MKSKQVQEFKETDIGKIPEDWNVTRLENVCTLFVPERNKPKEFDGNIPWLRIEDLDGKFVSDSKSGQYVNHETVNKMNLKVLPIGTILCSCTATIGICAITQKELITNQQLIGIYPTDINNEFLYYYLLTQTKNLINNAYGTIGGYITRKRFEEFQIILPPIHEQKFIAKTLAYFDSKIEKLQNQNKILEQIAQTIFKSWFFDFDGQTEFEDSELGRIPKGWKVKKLDELIVQNKDKIVKKEEWNDENIIDLSTMPRFSICLDSFQKGDRFDTNVFKLRKMDILFGSIRPYFGKAGFSPINGCVTGSIFSYLPKNKNHYAVVLFATTNNKFINFTDRFSKGTKMPTIGWDDFCSYKIAIPSNEEIIKKFNCIIIPILKKIILNIEEIHTHSSIKNSILPKLMSGEIRV